MLNICIDTNILLSFYHLSSDDLEELNKLVIAMENNEIVLFLPEQIISEYKRNRENKIADALKIFKEQKLNNQFPQICKGYPEYEKMQKAIKQYKKSKHC